MQKNTIHWQDSVLSDGSQHYGMRHPTSLAGDGPIDHEKDGWHLMSYQQLPLGWTKRIATRFNNYYPLHWRIRMELPGELPKVGLLDAGN